MADDLNPFQVHSCESASDQITVGAVKQSLNNNPTNSNGDLHNSTEAGTIHSPSDSVGSKEGVTEHQAAVLNGPTIKCTCRACSVGNDEYCKNVVQLGTGKDVNDLYSGNQHESRDVLTGVSQCVRHDESCVISTETSHEKHESEHIEGNATARVADSLSDTRTDHLSYSVMHHISKANPHSDTSIKTVDTLCIDSSTDENCTVSNASKTKKSDCSQASSSADPTKCTDTDDSFSVKHALQPIISDCKSASPFAETTQNSQALKSTSLSPQSLDGNSTVTSPIFTKSRKSPSKKDLTKKYVPAHIKPLFGPTTPVHLAALLSAKPIDSVTSEEAMEIANNSPSSNASQVSVTVPFGWQRFVEDSSVIYYSPSKTRLVSGTQVKQYLQTEGTCKCGLECPINVDKVFNFDPSVTSQPWSLDLFKCNEDLTKLCNHKRKIIAMATLQSTALQNDSYEKRKSAKGGAVKKRNRRPKSNDKVAQLLAQREIQAGMNHADEQYQKLPTGGSSCIPSVMPAQFANLPVGSPVDSPIIIPPKCSTVVQNPGMRSPPVGGMMSHVINRLPSPGLMSPSGHTRLQNPPMMSPPLPPGQYSPQMQVGQHPQMLPFQNMRAPPPMFAGYHQVPDFQSNQMQAIPMHGSAPPFQQLMNQQQGFMGNPGFQHRGFIPQGNANMNFLRMQGMGGPMGSPGQMMMPPVMGPPGTPHYTQQPFQMAGPPAMGYYNQPWMEMKPKKKRARKKKKTSDTEIELSPTVEMPVNKETACETNTSFLENPTEFMAKQTALMNSNLSHKSSLNKPTSDVHDESCLNKQTSDTHDESSLKKLTTDVHGESSLNKLTSDTNDASSIVGDDVQSDIASVSDVNRDIKQEPVVSTPVETRQCSQVPVYSSSAELSSESTPAAVIRPKDSPNQCTTSSGHSWDMSASTSEEQTVSSPLLTLSSATSQDKDEVYKLSSPMSSSQPFTTPSVTVSQMMHTIPQPLQTHPQYHNQLSSAKDQYVLPPMMSQPFPVNSSQTLNVQGHQLSFQGTLVVPEGHTLNSQGQVVVPAVEQHVVSMRASVAQHNQSFSQSLPFPYNNQNNFAVLGVQSPGPVQYPASDLLSAAAKAQNSSSNQQQQQAVFLAQSPPGASYVNHIIPGQQLQAVQAPMNIGQHHINLAHSRFTIPGQPNVMFANKADMFPNSMTMAPSFFTNSLVTAVNVFSSNSVSNTTVCLTENSPMTKTKKEQSPIQAVQRMISGLEATEHAINAALAKHQQTTPKSRAKRTDTANKSKMNRASESTPYNNMMQGSFQGPANIQMFMPHNQQQLYPPVVHGNQVNIVPHFNMPVVTNVTNSLSQVIPSVGPVQQMGAQPVMQIVNAVTMNPIPNTLVFQPMLGATPAGQVINHLGVQQVSNNSESPDVVNHSGSVSAPSPSNKNQASSLQPNSTATLAITNTTENLPKSPLPTTVDPVQELTPEKIIARNVSAILESAALATEDIDKKPVRKKRKKGQKATIANMLQAQQPPLMMMQSQQQQMGQQQVMFLPQTASKPTFPSPPQGFIPPQPAQALVPPPQLPQGMKPTQGLIPMQPTQGLIPSPPMLGGPYGNVASPVMQMQVLQVQQQQQHLMQQAQTLENLQHQVTQQLLHNSVLQAKQTHSNLGQSGSATDTENQGNLHESTTDSQCSHLPTSGVSKTVFVEVSSVEHAETLHNTVQETSVREDVCTSTLSKAIDLNDTNTSEKSSDQPQAFTDHSCDLDTHDTENSSDQPQAFNEQSCDLDIHASENSSDQRQALAEQSCDFDDNMQYDEYSQTPPDGSDDHTHQHGLKRPLPEELEHHLVTSNKCDMMRSFNTGDLVWGQLRGYQSWPGQLVDEGDVRTNHKTQKGKLWVKWFGNNSVSQVEPTELKTLDEGLDEHHTERKKLRKGRKMNSNLESAIQEAMSELDKRLDAECYTGSEPQKA